MKIEDDKLLRELKYLSKNGKSLQERRRSHALLLSHDGYTKREIASILQVTQRAVFLWLKEFKERGIESLRLKSGRGRKPKLSSKRDKEIVKKYIEKYPNQPKKAYALTIEDLGINISYDTFKRFLKKHCT
jgi:transposase